MVSKTLKKIGRNDYILNSMLDKGLYFVDFTQYVHFAKIYAKEHKIKINPFNNFIKIMQENEDKFVNFIAKKYG